MSKGMTGVPKAAEHKAKIAASQRRRHAAVRVLTAVEAFHRGNQTASSSEPGAGPPVATVNLIPTEGRRDTLLQSSLACNKQYGHC